MPEIDCFKKLDVTVRDEPSSAISFIRLFNGLKADASIVIASRQQFRALLPTEISSLVS